MARGKRRSRSSPGTRSAMVAIYRPGSPWRKPPSERRSSRCGVSSTNVRSSSSFAVSAIAEPRKPVCEFATVGNPADAGPSTPPGRDNGGWRSGDAKREAPPSASVLRAAGVRVAPAQSSPPSPTAAQICANALRRFGKTSRVELEDARPQHGGGVRCPHGAALPRAPLSSTARPSRHVAAHR